jgi:hypothetical protein
LSQESTATKLTLIQQQSLSGPRFRWLISGLSMTSLHGVGHQIVHPSEWPSPIKGIAQTLGRPLPTYLATEPHPVVPGRASSILQELHCGSFRNDSQVSEETRLKGVFDIVLSTVTELRELVKWNEDGYLRPAVPLWSTLIKAIGHACSDEISIL